MKPWLLPFAGLLILPFFTIAQTTHSNPWTPTTLAPIPAVESLTEGQWLKGDLHLHSRHSQDASNNPISGMIAFSLSVGMDYICITDHDNHVGGDVPHHTWADPEFHSDSLLLLYGAEWTTTRGHGNVFSAHPYDHQRLYDVRDQRDVVIGTIKKDLGIHLSANHPNGKDHFGFSYDIVNSIEVWNSAVWPKNANAMMIWDDMLSSGRRLTGRGGSDSHHGMPAGVTPGSASGSGSTAGSVGASGTASTAGSAGASGTASASGSTGTGAKPGSGSAAGTGSASAATGSGATVAASATTGSGATAAASAHAADSARHIQERMANYIGTPTTWVFAKTHSAQGVVDALTNGRVSISANPFSPRVEFYADLDGDGKMDMMMGDNVAATGSQVRFHVVLAGKVSDTAHYTIDVVKNGDKFATYTVVGTHPQTDFVDTPAKTGRTYYRLEVHGTPNPYPQVPLSMGLTGNMIGLSNPIYFNFDPNF